MNLYGYTPAFTGMVDASLIVHGDSSPPQYLFRFPSEEGRDWLYSGWSTVISVNTPKEAAEIAAKLEKLHEDAHGNLGG